MQMVSSPCLPAGAVRNDKPHEIFPAFMLKAEKRETQRVEKLIPPAETGAGFLVQKVAQYHQAVLQECQQKQYAIDFPRMLLPMPEIMR